MSKLALKMDGKVLDQMPCEPANIRAILELLDGPDPSIHHMLPFFEQDLVLTLKVISLANQMMKGRSTKAIAVRGVSHALSIIGFNGVQQLVQSCLVCDAADESMYFQVYRFTLARAHLLLSLCQSLSAFHPVLNQDDIRLYVSILVLGQLWLGREQTDKSNILFFLYQREPVDFWTAEMSLLGTTVIDLGVKLSQEFDLPRETRHALDAMPGLEQFFYGQESLNLKKVQHFLTKKSRAQDMVLPVIVLCYCLVNRSPFLCGDKSTWYIVRWIARYLNRSVHEIWAKVNSEFLSAVRTYPLLNGSARALLLPGADELAESIQVEDAIGRYQTMAGLDELKAAVDIAKARKMPVIDKLAKASLGRVSDVLAAGQADKGRAKAPKPRQEASSAPTVERQPEESVQRFIDAIIRKPSAYGPKLPAASALLETLRIGFGAAFGVAIFFDEKKSHFWVGCVTGLASRHPIRQWTVPKSSAGLLNNFLKKAVGIHLKGDNRELILKAMPKTVVTTIGECEALMCSTRDKQKDPTGLIIMVSHHDEMFSKSCYSIFQKAVFATPL